MVALGHIAPLHKNPMGDLRLIFGSFTSYGWRFGVVVNGVSRTNKVNQHRARLVP